MAHHPPKRALVHDLLEDAARRAPSAIAVVDRGVPVTFTELETRANRLAHALSARGAGPGRIVAIQLPRSASLVVSLLAVLKSGAAYAPIDPRAPELRRDRILSMTQPVVIVSSGPAAATLGASAVDLETLDLSNLPDQPPTVALDLSDTAYVVSTSGSTGTPLPVAISHRSLSHHVRTFVDVYGITSSDRVVQFSNPAFDVLTEEIFPTLAAGARVVVAPDRLVAAEEFEALVAAEGVTLVDIPTPFWSEWTRSLDEAPRRLPASLRLVVIGADMGYPDTLRRWRRHTELPLMNTYGLSETTITTIVRTFHSDDDLPTTDTLPIGRPIPGAEALILDENLRSIPAGHPGELCIAGPILADGYLGHPDVTAARFCRHPFRPDERILRTGDSAAVLPDGSIRLIGRLDGQVKIRGNRVETAEVAAALMRHPRIRDARVLPRSEGPDKEVRLVAYVVPIGGQPLDVAALRRNLIGQLPEYMIPSAVVTLECLPLLPSGKVDIRALPDPTTTMAPATAPESELESTIANIWCDVLHRETVGLDDNFFDVGGHSLLLAQVRRRLVRVLGGDIPGVALFENPTVRSLARFLAEHGGGSPVADAPPGDEAIERRLELRGRLVQRRTGAARNRDPAFP